MLEMPKFIRNTLIITAMLIVTTLGMSTAAYAQPPVMPQQFYGTVSINNVRAEAGNIVSVKIDGAEKASVNTDSNGRYGYNPLVTITGTNGSLVEFYINGVQAQQVATYSSGAITKVDLSVGAQMPPPSPPPDTPAPTIPDDGDDDQGSQTTQTTSTATGTTIDTNIMGQAGSFSINSANVLNQTSEFSSADGNFKIIMQADTVVNIPGQTLTASVETSPPASPATAELISAYKIEPSGTTFDPSITLSVKYDEASLPQGITDSKLYIAYWNNTEWVTISSTVNIQDNHINAKTTHFTIFGLFGSHSQNQQPPEAVFSISGLTISPLTAGPQEEITISADISNTGAAEGDYKVFLNINDINEMSKSVTLGPGASQEITFTTSKENAGKYEVTIGDQTGSFTISSDTNTQSGGIPSSIAGVPIWLFGVLALAILLIIILIVVTVRKKA
jgi:hypothetical protein